MKNYELMAEAQKRIEEYFYNYNEGLYSDEEAAFGVKTIAEAVYNHVERLYHCAWGEGYSRERQAETRTEHITYFTPDAGYKADDFKKIADLRLGESVTFYECGVHSVTRIK